MFEDESDEMLEASDTAAFDASEEIAADLANEREQVLYAELYLDKHPEEKPPRTEAEEQQEVIKHEMLKTAITQIENGARTLEDFEYVLKCWKRLEKNEARRLRNHQILRDSVPLEYDMATDGAIFPAHFTLPLWRQVENGNFLDAIFICPFEIDELTADAALSKLLRELKDDHKEIFYWLFIKGYSCAKLATMRGQTDRNIRKTRAVIVRKLRKQFQAVLENRERRGCKLTKEQKQFLEDMKKAALADDEDSVSENSV